MIPWGCNIHYHSNWFLLGRYFDTRTVAYLQTVRLILQMFSSYINLLRILGDERPFGCRFNNTLNFVRSRQMPISKLDRMHFNNP